MLDTSSYYKVNIIDNDNIIYIYIYIYIEILNI